MIGKIYSAAGKWIWREFDAHALKLGKEWVQSPRNFATKPPAKAPRISIPQIKKIIANQKPKSKPKDWSPSTAEDHARHSKTSRRIKQELASGKTGRRPEPGRRRKKVDPEVTPEITGYEGMRKGGSVKKRKPAKKRKLKVKTYNY
jgi:hypothetical protein